MADEEPKHDDDVVDSSSDSTDIDFLEIEEDEEKDIELTLGLLSRYLPRRALYSNFVHSAVLKQVLLCGTEVLSSFMYLYIKYGPRVLIPTVFVMLLIGMPAQYMELSIGQYASLAPYAVFNRMAPAFGGLGITSTLLSYLTLTTLFPHAVQSVGLFMASIQDSVGNREYDRCINTYNDQECSALERACAAGEVFYMSDCVENMPWIRNSAAEWAQEHAINAPRSFPLYQFLYYHLLGETDKVSAVASTTGLVVGLIIWVSLIYITSSGGSAIIVKLCSFAHTLGMALALCFFCYVRFVSGYMPAVTNVTEIDGITWNRTEIASSHGEFEMWIDTTIHVLNHLGVGEGVWVVIGSQHPFSHPVLFDCVMTSVIFVGIPYLVAYLLDDLVHSYLFQAANFSPSTYVNMRDMFYEKIDKSHTSALIPIAFSTLPNKDAFLFTYGVVSFLLTLCHIMVRYELIHSNVMEMFTGCSHTTSALINRAIVFSGMIFVMFATVDMGPMVMYMYNNYAKVTLIAFVIIAQVVTLYFFYGQRRVVANVNAMLFIRMENHQMSRLTPFLVFFNLFTFIFMLSTPFTLLIVVTMVWGKIPTDGTRYTAVALVLAIISPFIFVFLKRTLPNRHSRNKLRAQFEPVRLLWGPRKKMYREMATKMEKEFFIDN